MTGILEGRTIIVIGGASGIGRAAAQIAAREGANIVIGDLSDSAAVAVADVIGPNARGVALDVIDPEQIDRAIALAIEQFGGFDGLVNCAALPEAFRSMLDASEEDYAAILNVNVRGPWLATRAAIRSFRAQGHTGAIVNVASTAGLRGSPLMAIYSTSKHALIGLTRSSALEFAKEGHRINAVCPGVIQTPMMQRVIDADPRTLPAFKGLQPNGRFGEPEEVGEAIAWLLSGRAALVTGAILGVDGGATA